MANPEENLNCKMVDDEEGYGVRALPSLPGLAISQTESADCVVLCRHSRQREKLLNMSFPLRGGQEAWDYHVI